MKISQELFEQLMDSAVEAKGFIFGIAAGTGGRVKKLFPLTGSHQSAAEAFSSDAAGRLIESARQSGLSECAYYYSISEAQTIPCKIPGAEAAGIGAHIVVNIRDINAPDMQAWTATGDSAEALELEIDFEECEELITGENDE